jgi:hypothetical protein
MKVYYKKLFPALFIQMAYLMLMPMVYLFFSFLAFGEGDNSFMYTNANLVISNLITLLPISIFNCINYIKNKKNHLPKTHFIIAQLTIMVLYFIKVSDVIYTLIF